jgi:hypothetical protein
VLIITLCDDIREEVAGKLSLMGLFNQFRVADFRSPMPAFWIYARVEFEQPGDYEIRTELRTVEGQGIFQLRGVTQLRPVPTQQASLALPTADLKFKIDNLTLPRDGLYEIALFYDDQLLQTLQVEAVVQRPGFLQ